MNKNLAIIIFMIVFFFIYSFLLFKFLPNKPPEKKGKEKIEQKVELKSLNLKEGKEIFIENEFLKLTFSEKGGYLKSILFKKYSDKEKNSLNVLNLNFITPYDTLFELGEKSKNSVIFSTYDGKAKKEIILTKGYKLKIKFKGIPNFLFSLLPFIDPGDEKIYTIVEYSKGKIKKHKLKDFLNVDYAGENTLWFGSEGKYFISVIIKPDYFKKIIKGEEYKEGKLFNINLEPTDSFYVYLGPKDYPVLKKEGFGLENLYPLGFSLVKPFTLFVLYSFRWSYGILKHFSIVILIFTLLMKIIFMPLTIKSLKAMKKMEELKPRLEALKKAYKDDPKKLNEETLKLYKEMGVNPFSGCLPLLLQLPVFWALYQVLRYDIMFRGAELFLWIKDLSYRDPFYILPILMGLSSLLHQFLQPTQDPQTRKIGFFMAGFITIIFLNFPAGLVYYWLLYNIFGLFETLLIKRRVHHK